MPEWMIIALVFFVVIRLVRGRRGYACSPRSGHRLGHRDERHLRRPREARTVAPPAETPEQVLQRRFVEGRITVEQYERELDRMLRT